MQSETAEVTITCPVCSRTSYNGNDVREGYCGFCHDWTSPKANPLVHRSDARRPKQLTFNFLS